MKLLTYIWRNVTRNKLRSSLTILSVGFSLALMTMLYGFLAMQKVIERESMKYDRVVVMNKLGFAAPLPIALVDRVRRMDSVAAATPFAWYGGNYQDRPALFAQFAVDPTNVFNVFGEYVISEDHLAAFQNTRQACVADQTMMEQMGWSIGDRIPLQGAIYPVDLELQLVGSFKADGNTGSLYFNWNYLDKQLRNLAADFPMGAGMIYVKCKDASNVATVCEDVDAMFANSENSTRTRTEAAFTKMFAEMLGDVQTYIRYISMAVVFALALVAATAMAMSIRERTTEIAVLKAIGFSKQRVLALVLGESTLIALLGGILGIALGLGIISLISSVPIAASLFPIPVKDLIGSWLAGLLLVAAGIGCVSGLVPAILAAQLSVVDGLRRVV